MKTNGDAPETQTANGNASPEEKTFPDTLSQKGALAPPSGYTAVRFWTEPVAERFSKVGTYEFYWVCCNLLNGKPPRYRE